MPEQLTDAVLEAAFYPPDRAWAGKLLVTMQQPHQGGDKLLVNYAGDTVR